jgi:hypothetical protein
MNVQFFVATILLIAVTGRQCPECRHGFWPHCLGGQICFGCKFVECKSEYVQNN